MLAIHILTYFWKSFKINSTFLYELKNSHFMYLLTVDFDKLDKLVKETYIARDDSINMI
jgi:hypothetical protein